MPVVKQSTDVTPSLDPQTKNFVQKKKPERDPQMMDPSPWEHAEMPHIQRKSTLTSATCQHL